MGQIVYYSNSPSEMVVYNRIRSGVPEYAANVRGSWLDSSLSPSWARGLRPGIKYQAFR